MRKIKLPQGIHTKLVGVQTEPESKRIMDDSVASKENETKSRVSFSNNLTSEHLNAENKLVSVKA